MKYLEKSFLLMLFVLFASNLQAQCSEAGLGVPVSVAPHNNTDKPTTLVVETIGFKEIKVLIYNKWGTKVFSSDVDILGASFDKSKAADTGWDGTSLGKELSAGIYVYSIEAYCLDKTYVRKSGTIVLTMDKKNSSSEVD